MLNKNTCKAIKKKLIDKDMTVQDLATEVGLSRVYVSNLINQLISNEQSEQKLINWFKENKNSRTR